MKAGKCCDNFVPSEVYETEFETSESGTGVTAVGRVVRHVVTVTAVNCMTCGKPQVQSLNVPIDIDAPILKAFEEMEGQKANVEQKRCLSLYIEIIEKDVPEMPLAERIKGLRMVKEQVAGDWWGCLPNTEFEHQET